MHATKRRRLSKEFSSLGSLRAGPGEKGLTLIEIIAIIVIVLIAAAVLLPVASIPRHRSLVAATKAEIVSISTACEAFKNDIGFYPPDEVCGDWPVPDGLGAAIIAPLRCEKAFKVQGDAGHILRDPRNGTTKGLVYLLGSSFTIKGKTYGPYLIFKSKCLTTPPWRDKAPRQFKPPPGVTVHFPGSGDSYPVLIMTDWYRNAYVYDSHFPEAKPLLAAIPGPNGAADDVHNATSFDMYSFGPTYKKNWDGTITDYDNPPPYPGEAADDINNWQ